MWIGGLCWVGVTGVIWGAVGVVFSRAAERKESFFSFLFLSSVFFAAGSWGFTTPAAAPGREILTVALLMVPAGLAGQAGFLALRGAMMRGSHGIGWTIAQAAMVCPFAVGILWFGEPAGFGRIAGIALLCAGLAASNRAARTEPGSGIGFSGLAFLAFALIGLQQTLTLIPNRIAALSPEALSWRVPLMSLTGLLWIMEAVRRRERGGRRTWRPALIYGLLVLAGQWAMFRAVDALSGCGSAGIAYPLAIGSCIVWFMLYSRFGRKEKIGLPGFAGLVLTVAGIALIAG